MLLIPTLIPTCQVWLTSSPNRSQHRTLSSTALLSKKKSAKPSTTLKTKSAGGADSLSPYHLKHSGPLLRTWLCHVFNTIVSLEEIPYSFKFGLITPVYKGKGKDPQIRGSFRGITLSSVLAKTLEFVLLERIIPVLADENIPQLTQTGFQKGVSCSDAIFSCLETIS